MITAVVPYKVQLPVHVPDEMWYRFEDVRYAAPLDEYDEPDGPSRLAVELRKYWVHHHTPKGVWLGLFRGSKHRFVLKGATRRFACATIAEAKVSFIARKRKQASIHHARAKAAEHAIEILEQKEWP